MSFDTLGLNTELLSAVEAQGYTKPTPIQAKAIPVIFSGRDIMAGAQTGTGKTAAFALPLLQILSETPSLKKRRRPRVLILTPTRELAAQVGESVQSYGRRLSLRSAVVYGGVKITRQIDRFQRGVDIVVATPGRLIDHADRFTVDLSRVEYLVLDEADRMLDMGFIHDIRAIIDYLPPERQNLMFSATYSKSIRKLADTILNNPELIEVAKRNTAAEAVTQLVHPVERGQKRALLSKLILDGKWQQVLVFTRTKRRANSLTKQLKQDGIRATAIHSDKMQSERTRALADFKKGAIRILVATDVAARGLDIDTLPHVVNFDLPNVPEDYVHRIGRTGRAGQVGVAISLVCRDEEEYLEKIQKLLKQKIPIEMINGFQMEDISKTPVKKNPGKRSGAPGKPKGGKPATKKTRGKPTQAQGNRSKKKTPANSRKKRRPQKGKT